MDECFRVSGRIRPKWHEQRGDQTYGEMTDEEPVDWTLNEDLVDTNEEASYRETYVVVVDGVHHVVFETNHPYLDISEGETDEIAIIHKIAWYK